MQPRSESRRAFARLEGLSKLPTETRGWAGTVLGMARRLHNSTFSLSEMYSFESELKSLYPGNENIRPKIRQQLQVLRDQGLLKFLGSGRYAFVGD
jgi:type II restriction enzyme